MSKNILVKYTRPSLYRIGDFRIIGGVNEVRKEVWDSVKENPGVKKRIESGEIVLMNIMPADKSPAITSTATVGGAVQPSEPAVEYPLQDLNVKEAKALIKETFDYKTLKAWYEKETRQMVLTALDKQLSEFAPPAKDEDNDNDSES